jgi:hypothetical protein
MTTLPEVLAAGTLTFDDALQQVAAQALAKLPEPLHERLAKAVCLVEQSAVRVDEDGTYTVRSRSNPAHRWHVNGSCGCEDATYQAPNGLCSHRLAVALHKRAMALLPPPHEERTVPAASSPETPHGIDPRHISTIQGKPFVKYSGLLAMAHERGLQSLKVEWVYNDAELSLAHAVATFQDGRRFEESGDATPANTNRKVAVHFRRVALTRAKARVLRDALGVDLVAVEELADE